MGLSKSNAIRGTYVAGQCISIFCAFAGSMFSIYDYRNPGFRKPKYLYDYLWIFGCAALATGMGGFTAYKFQGIKISGEEERFKPHIRYPASIAPRNWKSNLAESTYLTFSSMLTLIYNFFLIAAIQATYETFKDPQGSYPIVLPSTSGAITLLAKTLFADLLFKMTNEYFEAMEEIKEDITDSKAAPLISKIVKPLTTKKAYRPTLAWIKTVGVLSNSTTNYLGMLLSIPPQFLLMLHKQHHALFTTTLCLISLISIPILAISANKVLYFEGKSSETNLRRLKKKSSELAAYPILSRRSRQSSLLQRLLEWQPKLKWPVHYGFYAQGVIRGGADLLPVVLFIRDFFHRHGWGDEPLTLTVIPIAIFVFISSAVGTHNSEVTVAIEHYDRDFRYINDDNKYWPLGLDQTGMRR